MLQDCAPRNSLCVVTNSFVRYNSNSIIVYLCLENLLFMSGIG